MSVDLAGGPPSEILVVDDEPEVRELLTDFFHARKLRVASAVDGRAAITEIERAPSRFALILTDLAMPGADGLTVLAHARRANPSTAVVIITGYASLDSAIEAVRLGAYDYLTKPFSLGQLEILLKRVTDRLALETENRQLARLVDGRKAVDESSISSRISALEKRIERLELSVAAFFATK